MSGYQAFLSFCLLLSQWETLWELSLELALNWTKAGGALVPLYRISFCHWLNKRTIQHCLPWHSPHLLLRSRKSKTWSHVPKVLLPRNWSDFWDQTEELLGSLKLLASCPGCCRPPWATMARWVTTPRSLTRALNWTYAWQPGQRVGGWVSTWMKEAQSHRLPFLRIHTLLYSLISHFPKENLKSLFQECQNDIIKNINMYNGNLII